MRANHVTVTDLRVENVLALIFESCCELASPSPSGLMTPYWLDYWQGCCGQTSTLLLMVVLVLPQRPTTTMEDSSSQHIVLLLTEVGIAQSSS